MLPLGDREGGVMRFAEVFVLGFAQLAHVH
jgi:hypothetical protein